jgi:acyl-CoA oxidase
LADGTYVSQFKSEGKRFGALLGELVNGRTNLAVCSLNFRKMAATLAVRYCHRTKIDSNFIDNTKKTLLEDKYICIRLMPVVASCYAAQFANREILKKFKKMNLHREELSTEELAETHAYTAGFKSIYTWDTQKYLQVMREICGEHGYAAWNKFGTLRDDHDIWQTYEGDNTVLIQQLGAFLMKQFSKQFKQNIIQDGITFLRMKLGSWLKNRNPIIIHNTSTSHLRDSLFQIQAFEYRTATLLKICAQKFNKEKRTTDPFIAWNNTVPIMINLGRAFVQQFTLEEFVKQLESIEDKKNTPIYESLKLCCDVYALSIMEENIGEFLDLFKRRKAEAISALLGKLCFKMRKHAVSLVDAFEIPEFLLESTIGSIHDNYISNVVLETTRRN